MDDYIRHFAKVDEPGMTVSAACLFDSAYANFNAQIAFCADIQVTAGGQPVIEQSKTRQIAEPKWDEKS